MAFRKKMGLMTIYFQHVGEAGGKRDFPRTIGTEHGGLVQFSFADIKEHLSHLGSKELAEVEENTLNFAPDGFQIWGIPSGARSILRSFSVGDYLLLLETVGSGGSFAYAGRAIAIPSQESFALSKHLWGEERFPLIVLMKGNLTGFSWYRFCDEFSYKHHWNPAGQTYRLQPERVLASSFTDEDSVIAGFIGSPIPLLPTGVADDEKLIDLVELDITDVEGQKLLRQHIVRERSSRLIREFKRSLKNFMCCVCGFDFEEVYGLIGEGFIEAHHIKPISELRPGERVSLKDLIPVCSNCHRMLHRKSPPIDWEDLREAMR